MGAAHGLRRGRDAGPTTSSSRSTSRRSSSAVRTWRSRSLGALAATGLAANRLELEITEAVLIRDDEAALAMLHQLRELGVRIALDDFGTGYSSLSYLQRFPFDKIKIDRCFVNDIARAGGSASIVQAVVNIAARPQHDDDRRGRRDRAATELLRALGCTRNAGLSVQRGAAGRGYQAHAACPIASAEVASAA